jgi:TetR/AcrR family transcriptional repressor of lmrAB and yxaGH operons
MSETRERMIATAMQLFRQSGYHGTSWRTLVEAAGTPWGSVHHHFPGGKEELGVAAIAFASRGMVAAIESVFAEARSPAEAVRKWCRLSGEQLEKSEFVEGCPVATVALETSSSSSALASATKKAFDEWCAAIAAHLEADGIPAKRAAQLATLTLITLEGALLVARVSRSKQPMLLVADELAQRVDAEPRTARRPSKRRA